jgi:hypothetical protein
VFPQNLIPKMKRQNHFVIDLKQKNPDLVFRNLIFKKYPIPFDNMMMNRLIKVRMALAQ